jgi:hypothetical protein
MITSKPWPRRQFIQSTTIATGGLVAYGCSSRRLRESSDLATQNKPVSLPEGSAPPSLPCPHFPNRLCAFVWRNWQLVPLDRLAAVVGASTADIRSLGDAMGLGRPPRITLEQQRRSYITVIKRNWHLLPYEQLLHLLNWTAEELAYTLREDDFLFVKLGNLKPRCAPLRFEPLDATAQAQLLKLGRIVREEFPTGLDKSDEPLFDFVHQLSAPAGLSSSTPAISSSSLSYCYSYFALYGDPFLEPDLDPYPNGYLERLANLGVGGVWLQALLPRLAPFPWDAALSQRWEERQANLRKLVERLRRHGMGLWLYLNEPRSLPLDFFEKHPDKKGVVAGNHATLCTSHTEVQQYLIDAIASVSRAAPDLEGFFTITASENLTNCWSHGAGQKCPRCGKRSPAEVIAEVNTLICEGIRKAGSRARLVAWDWGWADNWAEDAIRRLPPEAALMSVSEWSLPIQRGGIATTVGEYSISAIGPGPRARKHWAAARKRGLKTIAKIQAGNTWELSAVPYIPAVENVARHAANLRDAQLDGFMLGWTLGGYPSPNLEVVAEIRSSRITVEEALNRVAAKRYGLLAAPAVTRAWHEFSQAFSEFPYHGGLVYSAPLQVGPANLFYSQPTSYRASMVGFPYDDTESWRSVYPIEIFISQLTKVADGFDQALGKLKASTDPLELSRYHREALAAERRVAEAAAIHFRSVANQARFIRARNARTAASSSQNHSASTSEMRKLLQDELQLAKRLHAIQTRDSRIGFEASNHYFYIPLDLAEKVLNCRHLLGSLE